VLRWLVGWIAAILKEELEALSRRRENAVG